MKSADLNQWQFADKASREEARAALACVKHGRRGAWLVLGPPAADKMDFVREIIGSKWSDPVTSYLPVDGMGSHATLNAILGRGYAIFEPDRPALESPLLLRFIQADAWPYRPPFAHHRETRKNCAVVFLVGTSLALTAAEAALFRVIRLADRTRALAEAFGRLEARADQLGFEAWEARQ